MSRNTKTARAALTSNRTMSRATLSALLLLFAMMLMAGAASAGTAKLQVIHNAADPAAAVVDIYLNEGAEPLLDDFGFRDATAFTEVPAGVELRIGVAPGNSSSADDVIATIPLTLKANRSYVAIANGVLGSEFADNPDRRSIGFDLYPSRRAATRSFWNTVRLLPFHGATDAPAVDIRTTTRWGATKLVGDLAYGDFGRPRYLLPREYVLDVTLAGQADAVVASYVADLRGLAGGAAVVFASGFLDPSANSDGPAFGLYAALPDGTVLPLDLVEPEAPTAFVQVIHNAADPAAASVDVYLNDGDEPILDDFAFRAATPFVELPAGEEIVLSVAPGTSASAEDAIADFALTLEPGERYVVFANGVVAGGFAENPNGLAIGFDLFPVAGVPERTVPWVTKILAFHGSTDAPTVDIRRRTNWGSRVVFDDVSYGDSGFSYLFARRYALDVTLANDADAVVVSYEADLRGLGGQVAVVFASGFLDPSANANGPGFGLFAALADGTVLPLPAAAAERGVEVLAKAPVRTPFELRQNYPNPFNPRTSIAFSLPREGRVALRVYNQRGEIVRQLVDETRAAGPHVVDFDGSGLSSGAYFYRLTTEDRVEARKMLLVK